MRRVKSSWSVALLLATQAIADPRVQINSNLDSGAHRRSIENLEYGSADVVGRAQEHKRGKNSLPALRDFGDIGSLSARAVQVQGLDVNSLLNEVGQGQGHSIPDACAQPVGASQGGLREGIDANSIMNSHLNANPAGEQKSGQSANKNDIAMQLEAGKEKGQGSGNEQGNNIEIIEVTESIAEVTDYSKVAPPTTQSTVAAPPPATSPLQALHPPNPIEAQTSAVHKMSSQAAAAPPPPAEAQISAVRETQPRDVTAPGPTYEAKTSAIHKMPSASVASPTVHAMTTAVQQSTIQEVAIPPSNSTELQKGTAQAEAESSPANTTITSAHIIAQNSTALPIQAQATGAQSGTSTPQFQLASSIVAPPPTASVVTVIAGGRSSNSSGSKSLTKDGLIGATTTTPAGQAVTVVAGNSNSSIAAAGSGSAKGQSRDPLLAATTTTKAGAGVTVVAGVASPSGGSANAQAAPNGACNCACNCPANAFPMEVPQAAANPFQLQTGTMAAMSAAPSTFETQSSATTVVAEGIPTGGFPQAAGTSSPAAAPIDSATLNTASLIASTTTSVTGPGFSLDANAPASPSASSSTADANAATSAIPAPTPALAQPQLAGSSSAVASASAQKNALPFDISTISLQSKVTVNLGARAARATPHKRRVWS